MALRSVPGSRGAPKKPTIARTSTRALPEDEAENVRVLTRLLVLKFGSQPALAKALGMKQQTISQVLSGSASVGYLFARQLAALIGYSVAQVLAPRSVIDEAVAEENSSRRDGETPRWHPATIAAVQQLPKEKTDALSIDAVRDLLDRMEEAVRPVLDEYAKKKRR